MDSRFDPRDPNTTASGVWQGLVVEVSRSTESWRNKGISSLYAPGTKEFLLAYRGYILILRLEFTDIVASIQNPSVPAVYVPGPRRFKIQGDVAKPIIREDGAEWTFLGMIDELTSWFRRVVDSQIVGNNAKFRP